MLNSATLAADVGKLAKSLPPFPAIAHRILALASSEDVGAHELGGLIKLDPSFSAEILRFANSALFSVRRQVTSLTRLSVDMEVLAAEERQLALLGLPPGLQALHIKLPLVNVNHVSHQDVETFVGRLQALPQLQELELLVCIVVPAP